MCVGMHCISKLCWQIYANISLHLGVRRACFYQPVPAGLRLSEMEGAMRKVKSYTILLEWIREKHFFSCHSAAGEQLYIAEKKITCGFYKQLLVKQSCRQTVFSFFYLRSLNIKPTCMIKKKVVRRIICKLRIITPLSIKPPTQKEQD